MYGADGVDYSPAAEKALDRFEDSGFGDLPICLAKTHLSLSSDPKLPGAPRGWRLPVREVRASVGAGFIYPIAGTMQTMPGLGKHPAAQRIDLDDDGRDRRALLSSSYVRAGRCPPRSARSVRA